MLTFEASKYESMIMLDLGGYSKVYKATRISDGKVVAIKKLFKSRITGRMLTEGVPTEYLLLRELDHPNILKVYSLEQDESSFYIIMEYLSGRTCDWITDPTPEKLSYVFQQLLEVLGYLSKKKIAHRDIKLDNIMVDDSMKITLIDFGFSCKVTSLSKDRMGTWDYLSPEILSQQPYDLLRADIWSLGVVFYILLTKKLPFHGERNDLFQEILKKDPFLDIPMWTLEKYSVAWFSLVREMLNKDPDERPCIEELLETGVFDEYNGASSS